ncbi:MAG: cold shock domain-containing protein [Calditrichaeota bacterium]|nr:cold shock domain-containing protein [Calditrichota bacterium]
MVKGTVKSWDAERGFGFITTDDDEDVFVNISDIHPSLKSGGLREGDRVKFDIRTSMKGDQAINVRLDR